MKLSVVICSRSGIPDRLKKNLSLQTYQPDEVIEVVGDALTTQRNKGVTQASGDLITFLDDDIILDTHYLEEVVNTFYTHSDAMAVTGNIQTKMFQTNIFYTLYAHLFLLSKRGQGRFLVSGFPESYHKNIMKVIKGEVLCGCNMTIRKEAFEELSFNENLEGGMFGEDDYFSYQLSREYVIYYNPHAVCYDNRDYPKGSQSWKVRCTIINLIKRYRDRKPDLLGRCAFWWALGGFVLFKLIESLVMFDSSIARGILWTLTRRTPKH